jgi:tetratricopeptide (TPR) repeat protein
MPDVQQQLDDLRAHMRALSDSPDAAAAADLERRARALLTDAKNTPYESEAQALFAELARASAGGATSASSTSNASGAPPQSAATVKGLLRRARIRIEIAGDDEDVDEAIDILAQALELAPQDADVIALLDEAGRHNAQAGRRVADLFARLNVWRPSSLDAAPHAPPAAPAAGDERPTPTAGGERPISPASQPNAGYVAPPPGLGRSAGLGAQAMQPTNYESAREALRDAARDVSRPDTPPAAANAPKPDSTRDTGSARRATGSFPAVNPAAASPDLDGALSELTQLYYAGDYQQVVDAANRILNQAPGNPTALDYRQKAEDNLIRGVVPDHRIPFEARVAYNRANSLVRAGNYDEAERLYREARDTAERSGILSWKDAEQALLDIQDLALARELLLEGDRLMSADTWQEALRKYEGALRVVPNDPQAEDRIDKLRRIQQDTEAVSVQMSMLSGALADQAAQLQNILGTVTRLRQSLPNSKRLAGLAQDAANRLNAIKSQLTDQANGVLGRGANAAGLNERLNLTNDALQLLELAVKLDPSDAELAVRAQEARASATDMQRARQVIERAAELIAQNFDNDLLQARSMLTGLLQYAQDGRYRAIVSDLLGRYIERAQAALDEGDFIEADALLQTMREEPFNILGRRSEVARLENAVREQRGRTRLRNAGIVGGGITIILLFLLLTQGMWLPVLFPPPTPTPTATFTPSMTFTASNTPTPSDTPTPSNTPTASNTPSPTVTPSFTATPSWTWTPSHTPTHTITPSETPRPSETPSVTPTPTITPTLETLCTVITRQNINVRSRPAAGDTALVAQLPTGTVLRVLGVETGLNDGLLWYRIEADYSGIVIRNGYVRSDTVNQVTPCPSF